MPLQANAQTVFDQPSYIVKMYGILKIHFSVGQSLTYYLCYYYSIKGKDVNIIYLNMSQVTAKTILVFRKALAVSVTTSEQ